jgi:hypothetical protein
MQYEAYEGRHLADFFQLITVLRFHVFKFCYFYVLLPTNYELSCISLTRHECTNILVLVIKPIFFI